MIDHLLSYTDEAEALADDTLAQWRQTFASVDSKSERLGWNGSLVFSGVEMRTEGGALPGWWIIVSLDKLDKALAASPHCQMVTDREADQAGEAFIQDHADAALKFDPSALVSIGGKPAGSVYEDFTPTKVTTDVKAEADAPIDLKG